MKKLAIFLVGIAGLIAGFTNYKGSPKDTLITVGNEEVSINEFLYAFNKNRLPDSTVARNELDEYLQLYINFKLKVAEAKSRGMDTTTNFLEEYNSYIDQLDNSYLQGENDDENLVDEAFNRLQFEISAAHILFTLDESAPPQDTIVAYNKAIMVRDSILNGASFEQMATAFSEDPSAKKNQGNLGYFTVFSMVYAFETAAYSTSVGNISMPTRSRFGYHLIKVIDKRLNEGKVKVAHIMIRNADGAKEKAFALYDQLVGGADWDQLCKENSDDAQSASRAGVLVPFSKNQIVAEFSSAAFALNEVGQISDPVKTAYGWHIIRLIEKIPIGDLKENENQLRAKIRRDGRANISKKRMVERLAKANNLAENTVNVNRILVPENHQFQDGKWVFTNDSLTDLTLFLIGETQYPSKDYYSLIESTNRQVNSRDYLFEKYKKFKEDAVIEYEKAHLADKYDDYKYLRQEYYDGILLFSIMEEEVWARAGEDSLGLASYYKIHKNEFIDTARIEAAIFFTVNKATIDALHNQIPSKKEYLRLSIDEKQELLTVYNDSSQLSLQLDSGKFIISEHPVLQKLSLPYKATVFSEDDKWYFVIPLSDPLSPLPLADVRGKLMAGYQVELENKWLKALKTKYPVVVKKANLKKIYKVLEIQN